MHPRNSQLNETRLSQLLEVMKILQYIIQFSAACACNKQKESSSFLLRPRQTPDCMSYWSSCWGSPLCPTDVSNSTWDTIWVIFPSNGFTSELQNRRKQKSSWAITYNRVLDRTHLRTQSESYSSSFVKCISAVDSYRKVGKQLWSVKGKRLKNHVSFTVSFTPSGANMPQ